MMSGGPSKYVSSGILAPTNAFPQRKARHTHHGAQSPRCPRLSQGLYCVAAFETVVTGYYRPIYICSVMHGPGPPQRCPCRSELKQAVTRAIVPSTLHNTRAAWPTQLHEYRRKVPRRSNDNSLNLEPHLPCCSAVCRRALYAACAVAQWPHLAHGAGAKAAVTRVRQHTAEHHAGPLYAIAGPWTTVYGWDRCCSCRWQPACACMHACLQR